MESDWPEARLLITVGTEGMCVFAWEGITGSEIEDALEVIQEFVTSKRPNPFTMNGERTENRITVQAIGTRVTLKPTGGNNSEGKPEHASCLKNECERG
jgi:hypothetical protein